MERLEGVRRLAGTVCVAVGLAAMVAWTATGPERSPGLVTWVVVAVIAIACLGQLAPVPVRWWLARIAAVTVGVLLLGAVADRFGLLGTPGDPGVSWGDWSHFRSETAELVPWSPLVQPAAVAATAAELLLGALLLTGRWHRRTGEAAAGLFLVYLVTMIPGMGASSVLEYGVPVLIGGCLLASTRGPRPRSSRDVGAAIRADVPSGGRGVSVQRP
jgi:hypothetical protein